MLVYEYEENRGLAKLDGKIVGTVWYELLESSCRLDGIQVDAAYRGCGIGSLLISNLADRLYALEDIDCMWCLLPKEHERENAFFTKRLLFRCKEEKSLITFKLSDVNLKHLKEWKLPENITMEKRILQENVISYVMLKDEKDKKEQIGNMEVHIKEQKGEKTQSETHLTLQFLSMVPEYRLRLFSLIEYALSDAIVTFGEGTLVSTYLMEKEAAHIAGNIIPVFREKKIDKLEKRIR